MDRATEKYILNLLRQGTVKWPGRSLALKRASKQKWEGKYYKKGKRKGQKRLKTFWKCKKCENWFRNQADVQVDHIEEVGSYCGDFHIYAYRMYCDQENLQVLCCSCHLTKSSIGNASRLYKRKSPLR